MTSNILAVRVTGLMRPPHSNTHAKSNDDAECAAVDGDQLGYSQQQCETWLRCIGKAACRDVWYQAHAHAVGAQADRDANGEKRQQVDQGPLDCRSAPDRCHASLPS